MFINFAKTAILNHFFKGTVYTQPTNLYVGLSTTDLLADGSGVTEVTGGGYARQVNNAWTIAVNQVSNTGAVTFPIATASWGTPIQWFMNDALTLGNYLCRGPIVYPNTLVPFIADHTANVVYVPSIGFTNGQNVRFYAQLLPSGISGNTSYFVITANTTNDSFQISLTNGGAAVTIIADGHGFVGQDFSQPVVLNNTVSFAASQLIGLIEG